MDYGTLRVATPDGQIREHPITVPTVVIGRADGNQVVIDHVSVSRRHAQLVIESGRVTIQDMGSGTGTFVGSARIPANTPSLVESGQTMRFGEVEARFVFAEALASTGSAAAAVPETEQTIGVSLTSPSQPLAPGSPTTATVNVQNRGSVVDEVTIRIVDLPEGWARVPKPTVSLLPGARDEITVVIQPPKDSAAAAGDYAFSVAVTSKVHGREVRALGKLTVLSFEGFRVAIDPMRSKKNFNVAVANNGNIPITVALAGTDEAAELDYAFGSEHVEILPGEEKKVPLAVKTKSRKLFGPTLNKGFRVEARQGASGSPSSVNGQLVVAPPLQRYRMPSIFVLAAMVLGIVALVGRSAFSGGGDKADADPTPTQAAAASAAPNATATPTGLYVGGNGIIANSDPVPTNTNCLAVRSSAALTGNILVRLCTGEKVAIKGGPTNAEGYVWWQIQSAAGVTGFAAEKSQDGRLPFITPAP